MARNFRGLKISRFLWITNLENFILENFYPLNFLFNQTYCAYAVASYPGLLAPAFVACSTNAGEGLVKLSHVV